MAVVTIKNVYDKVVEVLNQVNKVLEVVVRTESQHIPNINGNVLRILENLGPTNQGANIRDRLDQMQEQLNRIEQAVTP